jgi:hypothetical protein
MENLTINSTENFFKVLREHWHANFLFRGEDSSTYKLCPKFGRFQIENPKLTVRAETAILHEFKRRAIPMVQHIPENDWEWLALAQHFGLATRLLDWTDNPLVAAYFATRLPIQSGDRVIYILDISKVKTANETVSPFNIQEVVIYRPKHIAPRITSQGGIFTVHPSPSSPFEDNSLERWIISEECVGDLYVELGTYGIHEAFIFPDLDGVARFVNRMYITGY